jgi:transposase
MIPDDLAQKILRLHFVEAWTVGTIAEHVGVHHSTVRRVLESQGIQARQDARPSISDPFLPFMQETLKEWPDLPASRLYAMAVERGYTGKPAHFRRIVARHRPRKSAEAFLRLSTLRGEQAQVDWAHCGKLTVGRAVRPLSAFVMVLSWSRATFVRFYLDQRLGSFLDGHQAAFEALGGVPRTLLYDNLKSVVAERRADAIRFNSTLLAFAGHYRYEPRPAAPYRGNEKGRVERRIRDLRESFLVARTIRHLDELNEQVQGWCKQTVSARAHPDDATLTVHSAWEEERATLRALPADRFPVHDRVEVQVGRTPYVRFEGNDYSVPHDRVRRALSVLATPSRIRILDGAEEVAGHVRCFDRGAQVEDPEHMRALVEWKRMARATRGQDRLRFAVPSSPTLLQGAASRGHNLGAAVAGLLRLVDTWGAARVEEAVQVALAADRLHVAAVRQVVEQRAQDEGKPPPVAVSLPDDPRLRDLHVQPHNLVDYDALGGSRDED